jgi:hypothetical protein
MTPSLSQFVGNFIYREPPSVNIQQALRKHKVILQRFNVKSKGLLHFSWTSGPRHVCTSTYHVTWKEVLLHFRFVRVIHGFHGDKLGMSAVLNQLHILNFPLLVRGLGGYCSHNLSGMIFNVFSQV